MTEIPNYNWHEEIGKMRMKLAKMETALKEIQRLTATAGYDLGYPEVYRIAKEALDD